MDKLTTILTILLVSSFFSLSATETSQETALSQDATDLVIYDIERTFIDDLYNLIGLDSEILVDEENKGFSAQQRIFEQSLKESLHSKQSLSFYLKILALSSILLTAASTSLVIRYVIKKAR